MEKPTLSDFFYALKINDGTNPFDAKYDVNGDGKVTFADVKGISDAYLGRDPGFVFAENTFLSPSTKTVEDYATEEKANKETERRQALLADAQKLNGLVSSDLVANNPNLTAQQLASLAQRNYWSNESEAFSRVMTGMENGTAQLKEVEVGADESGNPIKQLALTTGEHPGYDTLYLSPTSQKGVYQFSTPNQVAGGMISGVIQADPKTGQYKPVADYTRQIQYTPGQGGSFLGGVIGSFGDIIKELGPVATIIGNSIMPGLGTALSVVAAIDEGANPADIAKTIAISEGLSQSGLSQNVAESVGSQAAGQLAAGTVGGLLSGQNLENAVTGALTNLRPNNQFEAEVNRALDTPATQLSGQDLAADSVAGNTINDVIQQIVQDNNVAQDTLVSGQDLAADSTTGNTLQDVINNLTQNTTQSVVAQDTTTGGQDTLISGQDLSADTGTGANTLTDISTALAGEGSLISGQDLASDLKTGTANTLDDIAIALAGEGSAITGQDLAADATAGNTLADITNVLTDTKTDTTVDDVLNTLSNIAKVTALVNTADTILNPQNQETPKDGFDIVPVPTEWKSPTYNQTFTPIDLDSIFKNLQGSQYQWKSRPDITGGAFMGSPVNISDIVNKIMSAELTPTKMPSQITNAVGGILGPTATR